MKLASYQDGTRDGQLVVVDRHLKTACYATGIASKLQQALDDWNFISPQLQDLYDALNQGRARQNVKLNAANTSLRSKYRTVIKNVEKAVAAGDKAKAQELFATMQSVVDTVADKGIFHKNKAARDKSRLSAKVKALAAA